MHAACNICYDLFDLTKDVAVIPCGHTFHRTCLDNWAKISMTCPQCGLKFIAKNVIKKLYLENSDEHAAVDAVCLQNQMQNLQTTLLAKEKEINEANKLSADLRNQIMALQLHQYQLEANLQSLRREKTVLQSHQHICETQKIEINSLRNKLTELMKLEKIVKGSESEMEEVLLSCRMNYSVVNQPLLAYCLALKKELQRTAEQKKQESETATRRTSNFRVRLRQHEFALAQLQADLKNPGEDQNGVLQKVTALQVSFNSIIRSFSNTQTSV